MNKFEQIYQSTINESQPTSTLRFLDNLNTRLANTEELADDDSDKKEKQVSELAGEARRSLATLMQQLEELYKDYDWKI